VSQLIWAIVISGLLSAILTYAVLKIALKYKLALPVRERDVHAKQIPRLGGVAIFAAFFITTLGYHLANPETFSSFGFPFAVLGFNIDKRLFAVLLGGFILTLIMMFDDLQGLKAYHKLFVQVVVALILIAGGIGVMYLNNPFLGPEWRLDTVQIAVPLGGVIYHFVMWADLLAIVWLVFLMNVLNFSDGIDGLAGTIGAVALFILMLVSLRPPVSQPATALLAAIGFGAVLGFLIWNAPPAKLFMGDTGSMFIGFLIGVIGLIAGGKLAATAVVLAIPILDALLVLTSRLIKGQSLAHADQTHLHHRFLRAGFSTRQTLVILGGLSLLFGLSALQNTGLGKVRLFLLAVVITGILIVVAKMRQSTRMMNNK